MIVVFSWSDPETIWSSWHFFPPLSENTSNSRAIFLLGLHPCFHYFFPGRSIDVIPVHTPPSPPSWPYTQVDGLLLQPLPQGNDVAAAAAAKSLQSCPTLCNPVNCSLPGSSILGICQARVLEWCAIAFSDSCITVVDWKKSGPGASVSTEKFTPVSKRKLTNWLPQLLIPGVPQV